MQELKSKFNKEMAPIISAWGDEFVTSWVDRKSGEKKGNALKDSLLGKTFDTYTHLGKLEYTVNDIDVRLALEYLQKFAKKHKNLTMPTGSIKRKTNKNRIPLSEMIYEGNRLDKLILPMLEETQSDSEIKAELSAFIRQAMKLSVFSKKAWEIAFAQDLLNQYLGATLKNNRFRYYDKISMNPSDNADPYFIHTKYTQSALQKENLRKTFRQDVSKKLQEKVWQEAFTLFSENRNVELESVKDDYTLIGEAIVAGLEKDEIAAKRIYKQYKKAIPNALSQEDIKESSENQKRFAKDVKTKLYKRLFIEYNEYEQNAKMRSGILIPSSLYLSGKSSVRKQWGFLKNAPSNDNFDEALYTTFALIYYHGEPEKVDNFMTKPKGEVYKDVFSVFQFIYTVNFYAGGQTGATGVTELKTLLDKIKDAIKAAISTEKHDSEVKRNLYLSELDSAKNFLTIGDDIDNLGNLYAIALKECREQIPLRVKEQIQYLVDDRVKVEQIMGIPKSNDLFTELQTAGFITVKG